MRLAPLAKAALAVLALALPVLPAPARADAQTVPLGGNASLGGGTFSMGGGITVAVQPRQAPDGRLAVCGVWASSDRLSAYVRPRLRDVLAPGTLAVNGRVVLHDLRVFPQVAPAESYASAPATCIATDLVYAPATRVEIRIPRRTVVRERDRDGPSFDITFQPHSGQNAALSAGSVLPPRYTRSQSPGDKYPADPLND